MAALKPLSAAFTNMDMSHQATTIANKEPKKKGGAQL